MGGFWYLGRPSASLLTTPRVNMRRNVARYCAPAGYSAYSHQVLGVSQTVTDASCAPASMNFGLSSR